MNNPQLDKELEDAEEWVEEELEEVESLEERSNGMRD